MKIRYKTIFWEDKEYPIFEVKNIEFCCVNAESAWNNKMFVFDKCDNHICIPGEDKDYNIIYSKINYCPFCSAEIQTEEIEKVKTIRKIVKEVVEINRVVFEEKPV